VYIAVIIIRKRKRGVCKWQMDEILGITIEWKLLSLSPD
jgi:hypothetical protein